MRSGATEGPGKKKTMWVVCPQLNKSQAWPERLCHICWALTLEQAGVACNSKFPFVYEESAALSPPTDGGRVQVQHKVPRVTAICT